MKVPTGLGSRVHAWTHCPSALHAVGEGFRARGAPLSQILRAHRARAVQCEASCSAVREEGIWAVLGFAGSARSAGRWTRSAVRETQSVVEKSAF
jgi:hypothetical protein